jgi:hypothetical protein
MLLVFERFHPNHRDRVVGSCVAAEIAASIGYAACEFFYRTRRVSSMRLIRTAERDFENIVIDYN